MPKLKSKLPRRGFLKWAAALLPAAAVASRVEAEPEPERLPEEIEDGILDAIGVAENVMVGSAHKHVWYGRRDNAGYRCECGETLAYDEYARLMGERKPCTSMHLFRPDQDNCEWCGMHRNQVEMATGIDPRVRKQWEDAPDYSEPVRLRADDGWDGSNPGQAFALNDEHRRLRGRAAYYGKEVPADIRLPAKWAADAQREAKKR